MKLPKLGPVGPKTKEQGKKVYDHRGMASDRSLRAGNWTYRHNCSIHICFVSKKPKKIKYIQQKNKEIQKKKST